MKNAILILLVGIISLGWSFEANSQSRYKRKSFNRYKNQWQTAHDEGTFRLHTGVGFPSVIGTSTKAFESLGIDIEKSGTPPVHISGEYGFSEKFSGGLYLGYSQESIVMPSGDDDIPDLGWNTQFKIIGARGSYHFNGGKRSKFDPYVSVMMGYNLVSVELEADDETFGSAFQVAASGISYSFNLGMNYMFAPQAGVFAEVGYGVAYLNGGLTLSF